MVNILLSLLFLLPFVQPAESMFGLGHGIFIANKGAAGGTTPPASHFNVFSIAGSTVTSWYRADIGPSSLVAGTTITYWNDQSVYAPNNLVNTYGSPSVSRITQNGKPMIYFYGAADISGTNTPSSAFAQPSTEFIVFRPVQWDTGVQQTLNDWVSDSQLAYKPAGGTTFNIYAGVPMTGASGVSNNTTYIAAYIYNGSNSSVSINGGTAVTGNAGTQGNTGWPDLGTAASHAVGCAMYVAEWIVYKGALSDTDRATVVAGLNAWWSVY